MVEECRNADKILYFAKIMSIQAFGTFGLCQLFALASWLRSKMSEENFQVLFKSVIAVAALAVFGGVAVATFLGSM